MNPYDIDSLAIDINPPKGDSSLEYNSFSLPPIEQIPTSYTNPVIEQNTKLKPVINPNNPVGESTQGIKSFNDYVKEQKDQARLYEYVYQKNLDVRYNDPSIRYNPFDDTEKKYEDKQGQWGAFTTHLGEAWNTFKNTWDNHYIGQGRTYSNLVNLEGYEKIKNSFLNVGEQQNAYLNNLNYMVEHPVYNADPTDDSYFSMRGDFGSLIGSTGFQAASVVTAIQDTLVGQGMKLASKPGLELWLLVH